MILRKTLTALIGAIAAGLGVTALAAPAQADITVTVGGVLTEDRGDVELDGGTFLPSSIVGPTVTIDLQVDISRLYDDEEEDFNVVGDLVFREDGEEDLSCGDSGGSAKCGISVGETKTFIINPSADNSQVTLEWSNPEAGYPPIVPGFIITYSATPGGASSATPGGVASAGAGPAPLIQQFPRPVTGTCDEAASKDLNWSGVASGGWGESWSQWIDEGDGGAVCTRMLVYNTSTSAWEVD